MDGPDPTRLRVFCRCKQIFLLQGGGTGDVLACGRPNLRGSSFFQNGAQKLAPATGRRDSEPRISNSLKWLTDPGTTGGISSWGLRWGGKGPVPRMKEETMAMATTVE